MYLADRTCRSRHRIWKSICSFITPSRMRLFKGRESHTAAFQSPAALKGLSCSDFTLIQCLEKQRKTQQTSQSPMELSLTSHKLLFCCLLFLQYSLPKYIKTLMSWQRRKQMHQQTFVDETTFCSCEMRCMSVYVG